MVAGQTQTRDGETGPALKNKTAVCVWERHQMTEVFTGACQCGAVTYRVSGESINCFVCHCSQCQKQSASAFGMALWIANYRLSCDSSDLRSWSRRTPGGQDIVADFCGRCGSRLFHRQSTRTQMISIKPGTLDSAGSLRPVAHIWTALAQSWVVIPDDCLSYAGNPPGFEVMMSTWHQAREEQS